ncbi:MAG: sulfite exporter TauE/SafE family protein [Planctomycetales bacterium]|nr:sulfite exporter TauE/SafE family protein [Planctomycetales bacterium]
MSEQGLDKTLLQRWWPLIVFTNVAVCVWSGWLWYVGPENALQTIARHWEVALTMVFGSFVAGASSEGGGAVAFPVFTKVLHIAPADARLFALAIQSVGMSAASLAIIAMRVRVDWRAIGWTAVGGAIGVSSCLMWIAPHAPPAETKMLFTAMQASFAITLIITLTKFQSRGQGIRLSKWGGPALLAVCGLVGGVASGLVGSGIDLLVFSMLVLLFRLSEKVATPTSVIIMAINSLVAMAFYHVFVGPLPASVHAMWLSAAPIVVIGAPVGALVCSLLSREAIAMSLIGLIAIEVTTTFLLLPLTPSVLAVAVVAGGAFSYLHYSMARCQSFDPQTLRHRRSSHTPYAA